MSPSSGWPEVDAVAARVLALAESRPATLGLGRLICVDGPAGSGKTTLAAAIASQARCEVVHMDDLVPGWRGLPDVDPVVLHMLLPLSQSREATYRRWDWALSARAEEHRLIPSPFLVLEGCASGNRAWAGWITTLVWVSTDPTTQLARGMARDGEQMRPQWEQWMLDQEELFAREQTSSRADLVIPT